MGSPEFAVPSLEQLYNSDHEVVAVVTQPDRPKGRRLVMHPPPVKITAQRLHLPLLQPATTKSELFLHEMESFHPELLVVVAYGEILRPTLLNLPSRGAVNLHASLLPKYRGAAPIPWAILQGENVTGVTTMLLNEVMDGGDLLLQQQCEILPTDTTETLTKRLAHLGAPLLQQTVDLMEKNEVTSHPQDLTAVTYAPKLRKQDGQVDWSKSASWIARQFRAFDPWPGTFSFFRNLAVKLWDGRAADSSTTTGDHGTVIDVTKESLRVACGEGSVLEIFELD
jgi:methionyl-tRNA formyltransferase